MESLRLEKTLKTIMSIIPCHRVRADLSMLEAHTVTKGGWDERNHLCTDGIGNLGKELLQLGWKEPACLSFPSEK